MKRNILIIMLLVFNYALVSAQAFYQGTGSGNINVGTACGIVACPITNVDIRISSKTSVSISFAFKGINYSSNATINNGSATFAPSTAGNGTFASSCVLLGRTTAYTIGFTPTLSNIAFNSSPMIVNLTIAANGGSGNTSATINNISLRFQTTDPANITVNRNETTRLSSGVSVCSNEELRLNVDGFSSSDMRVLIDGNQRGNTVSPDNNFRVFAVIRATASSFFSNSSDGVNHTVLIYANGANNTPFSLKTYTPIANTNVITSNKSVSCYGEAVNLTVSVPNGINYAWDDTQVQDQSPRSVSVSKEYFVKMSKSGGACEAVSNKVFITVIPNFTAIVSPDKTQACEGQEIQLNATPNDANQYNFVWYNGATVTGTNSNNIRVKSNGQYSVKMTPKSGGCSEKPSNTVNNLSFEKGITGENISLTNSKTKAIFCKDETNITLSATASDLTNLNYQWSGPKTGSSKDLPVDTGGEYTVKFSRGACSVEKKITVIGKISPSVNVNPNDARICKGKEKASLSTNIINGGDYDYQWFGGSDGKIDLKVTTVNYDATESGLYRVALNPKGGNCSANGLYEANKQIIADNPIANFEITGRKANDIVPICNPTAGVNLVATTTENEVMISWNGGTPILKTNAITTKEDNKVFTAKFERGKCVENISVTTKIQELLASLKTPNDIIKKYITCADNIDFKLIAESNFSAATIKWKDANNANFAATGKEFVPKATGLYYAVANLPECGPNDSQGSSRVDITLVSDFKVNIASQLANPICDEATQTFTATPTYTAYTGGYAWTPNLSTTKTLQAKAEGSYTLSIQQDGCKATSAATITVKPSKPTITAIDNFILIASNDTKDIEWLFKELPSSTTPSDYKSLVPAQTSEQIYASKVGAYILKANRNNCGINYSTPFVISVINSNEDLVSNSWLVYPNPAISTITIENNTLDFSAQNTIEVRNSAGVLIKSWIQNENNKKYILDDLSAGMYHLIFNQKNGRTIKKIIKL